jgi:hypothetical protein
MRYGLLTAQPASEPKTRAVRRVYQEAVKEVLIVLWEAADRICGKRLKALLPLLVKAMERHGHLQQEGGPDQTACDECFHDRIVNFTLSANEPAEAVRDHLRRIVCAS